MSAYVNFYLRVNDSFAPIGSYSRNSEMYQAMSDYCPWEKIRAFTENDFMEVIHELENNINKIKKTQMNDETRCKMILEANNSLDEKMDIINEIESGLREMDDYIEEATFAADTLRVFRNMINDYRFANDNFSNDYNHYIYAGIEACGSLENVQE